MANQVLVAAVVLCVVLSMGAQVNGQPAPAPYFRGWVPLSAPTYAPVGAPEFAPVVAPEFVPVGAPEYVPVGAPEYAPIGSPELSAPPPYAFVPSPSVTFSYPNLAPGPLSA